MVSSILLKKGQLPLGFSDVAGRVVLLFTARSANARKGSKGLFF